MTRGTLSYHIVLPSKRKLKNVKVSSGGREGVGMCSRSSGWHFATRRRRLESGYFVYRERERERGMLSDAVDDNDDDVMPCLSSVRLPPLILIPVILVTISGLSTAATLAVFRRSPVTRDHRDKVRHHRRQGRTMPHAPRHERRENRRERGQDSIPG